MVCDRIRVAATICNEIETYSSGDRDRTPKPVAEDGAGQPPGSLCIAPGSVGQKHRGAHPRSLSYLG